MTYQKQTKDVWFKGRKVVDPSKQLDKTNKELETQYARYSKDMEAAGKDYAAALGVWKDIDKIPEKETLDGLKLLTDAGTKFFSDTYIQIGKVNRQKEIDKADKDWEKLEPEEKTKIKEYWNDQFAEEIKTQEDINVLANEAEQLGFKSYAALLRGKGKHYNTQMLILAGKEKLKGLDERLRTIFTGETWFTETGVLIHPDDPDFKNKAAFSGADALTDHARRQLVYDYLKKEYYLTAGDGNNLNSKLLVSTLKEDFDERIDKREGQFAEQESRQSMETTLTEKKTELQLGLSLVTISDEGKLITQLGFEENIKNWFGGTPLALNTFLQKSTPGQQVRADLNKIFENFIHNSSDRDQAAEIVQKIINKIKVQRPGGKPGDEVALVEIDGNLFNAQKYASIANGTHDDYQIPTAGAAEKLDKDYKLTNYTNTELKKKVLNGTATLQEQEEFNKTTEGQWLSRIKETGQLIPMDELVEQAKAAAQMTGNTDLIKEILNFNVDLGGAIMSSDETKKALDDLNDGTGTINGGHNVFVLGDQQTISNYLSTNQIEVTDQTIGSTDRDHIQTIYGSINTVANGGGEDTPVTEHIGNELETLFHTEYAKLNRTNQTLPEDQRKTDKEIIDEAWGVTQGLFANAKEDKNSIFYMDESGNFPNVDSKLEGWFGRKTGLYHKLQNEITVRKIGIKSSEYNPSDHGGKELSETHKLVPKSWLFGLSQLQSPRQPSYSSVPLPELTPGQQEDWNNVKLPERILDAAKAAGINPYEFVNNQVELYGLSDTYKLNIPLSMQTFLNTTKKNDINNVVDVLAKIGGDDATITNSIEASREINQMVNKISPRLQENNLFNTLATISGNSYSLSDNSVFGVRSDGNAINPHLGRYAIPRNTIISLCKEIGVKYPGDSAYLSDTKLQDRLAKRHISNLVGQLNTNFSNAQQLRQFYSLWATGEDLTIFGSSERLKNQGTFFLNTYHDTF